MNKETITVTSPLLPNLDDFNEMLKDIWSRKWITNNGEYHQRLEQALAEYLKVPYISLFTNGTLPLLTALQALRITGEVITTPYSFVATTHSIWWNGCKPVFVDIEEETCGIDPEKIEAAITPKTTAIMPVHCYGCPVKMQRIQEIADKYGLKVIYDAAHAFGVEIPAPLSSAASPSGGASGLVSVLNFGDMSTLSFHATKVYNTLEGGALVMHDEQTKKRIDYLKNFGFAGETEVVAPGINSKMDEVRAAYGLLNLKQVDAAIEARKQVARKYVEALKDIEGIRLFPHILESFGYTSPKFPLQGDSGGLSGAQGGHSPLPSGGGGGRPNYSYFPIFINAEEYGKTRDELYFEMKEKNVLGRRYFYPLISTFSTYRGLPSATPENLPVANKIANEVICLPMHHALTDKDIERVLTFLSL